MYVDNFGIVPYRATCGVAFVSSQCSFWTDEHGTAARFRCGDDDDHSAGALSADKRLAIAVPVVDLHSQSTDRHGTVFPRRIGIGNCY